MMNEKENGTGCCEQTDVQAQRAESIYSNMVLRLGQLCYKAGLCNAIGADDPEEERCCYPSCATSGYGSIFELKVYHPKNNQYFDNETYTVHLTDASLNTEILLSRMLDRVDDVIDLRRRMSDGWRNE